MFPTDHHPPYTIIHTENTQYCANSPFLSPSIQSLSSFGTESEYAVAGSLWEVVPPLEPTVPQPVHVTAYVQRSKSMAGLMRSSPTEMQSSRAVPGDTVDDVVEGNAVEDPAAAAEPFQRPRSATGLAQHTGQNMW